MWALFSVFILVIGALCFQYNHYAFIERQKTLDKSLSTIGELEKLQKEFTEYKKKVDALSLKAGFKL